MPPCFSAALVDLDGLLTDTEQLGQRTMAQTWQQAGLKQLEASELELYVGRPDDEVFADIAARRGLKAAEAQTLHRAYRRSYLENLHSQRFETLPGVREGLRRLAEQHPLALVTGSTREQAEAVLAKLELATPELWRAMITADTVNRGKPAPTPYLHAAAELGVSIHHCLVVEDSVPGVLAGRGAGASVLHVGPFHPQTSWIADRHVPRLDQIDEAMLASLWNLRPLPAKTDAAALRSLGRALTRMSIFHTLEATLERGLDLWQFFQTHANHPPAKLPANERLLWRLWIAGERLTARDLRPVLDESLLLRLADSELLDVAEDGAVTPRLRLLAVDGEMLLKEPPRLLANGRPLSRKTYLEGSSLVFLATVLDDVARRGRRPNRVLEVGTGTGLVLLRVLADHPHASGLGIDLDGRAVHLARVNAALNGLDSRLEVRQGDLFSPLAATERFDLVLCHPPYRLMPDEVPYPDPLSRYGTAEDGLGVVERFLADLDAHLADEGEALLFLDLPHSSRRPDRFEQKLRGAAPGMVFDFRQTGALVSTEQMARTSSEKCLQGDRHRHEMRILNAYAAIDADHLRPVLLRVHRGSE